MPTLKLIKWLLSAVLAVPVLTVLAGFALLLVGLVMLLPGGQEVLILEWERAQKWLPKARAFWRRKVERRKQLLPQKT